MAPLAKMYLATLLFFPFFFRPGPQAEIPASIYDFKVAALDGGAIDFSDFRGKKIMIVNTASHCGNTPQYAALQKLSEQYKDRLVIVGFPANNFFFEEMGSNKKIATFCRQKYGVTFPMAAKVSVRGWKTTPIYHWLTQKKYNGAMDSKVKWNFQKYLLDEHGKLTAVFSPSTPPDSPEIIAAIEKSKP